MSEYTAEPIKNLMAKEYEDARDAMYLNALKLNAGFDAAIKTATSYGIEKSGKIALMGSSVRVTQENAPEVYLLVEKGCRILGIEEMPQVFFLNSGEVESYVAGTTHPVIAITTGSLSKLTEDELLFVLGHELGHIKSVHHQFHYLGSSIASAGCYIPVVGEYVKSGVLYAYEEWARRADFTADRAGLLVCQNLEAAISALAKMGAYPDKYYERLDVNQFLEQADELKGFDEALFNKIIRIGTQFGKNYSWTVLRARELMLWVQSGEYSRILMRNSTWLRDEIERLSQKSDKAIKKHTEKRNIAEEASKHLQEKSVVDNIDEEISNPIMNIVSKGTGKLKAIGDSLNEGSVKKKFSDAESAKERLIKIGNREKKLRSIYVQVEECVIEGHVNSVLGDLRRL